MGKRRMSTRLLTKRVVLFSLAAAFAGNLSCKDPNPFTTITFKPELQCGKPSTSANKFLKGATIELRVKNNGECPISVKAGGKSPGVEPNQLISITFSPNTDTTVEFGCSSSEKTKCVAIAEWAAGGATLDLIDPTKKSFSDKCDVAVPVLVHHNLLKAEQKIKVEVTNTGGCPLELLDGIKVLDGTKAEKTDDIAKKEISVGKEGGQLDFRVKCKETKGNKCAFDVVMKLQP